MIKTLTHNGVTFPTPFESLGFNKINDIEISLLAEEMLYKFSPYFFNEKYNKNKTFLNNVWKDLKLQLPKELQKMNFPNDFEKLFLSMELVRANLKVAKSEYNKTHKKEIEQEKIEKKEKYGYCIKNGKKVELSNYQVEGSRWFISRGPLVGRWVRSVVPEDIEINASEDISCPIENHNWKCIELRDTDYIATYKIDIGFGTASATKCVWLSANSEDKQDDVREKYEHAIEFTKVWDKTYKKIINDCLSTNILTQENAMISYLIFTYGIRVGNEKGESNFRDETYGASTLLKKHVKVDGNNVTLHFSGKDSVIFNGVKKCHDNFVNALNDKIATKYEDSSIFTKANSSTVSEYLKTITKLDFVYPKMARTVLGTITLAKELQKREWVDLTDKQFKNQLMECCFEVTKKLNHKKTLTKEQSDKIDNTVKEKLEIEKEKLKNLEKITDEKLMKLKNDRLLAEHKGNKDKVKSLKQKEKELKEKYEKGKQKYEDVKNQLMFKKESKDGNINTAINSYSNPQLSFSLCKEANKDPSLIYSKTQLTKFEWAKNVSEEFWKKYPNV